jgi:hypothetical protein
MARTTKALITGLGSLPAELIEEIIAYLVNIESDREWTKYDESRRDGDRPQSRTPTSAHTASKSTTRKWRISALTLLPKSSRISMIRCGIHPIPIYNPQYADILNVRLTS